MPLKLINQEIEISIICMLQRDHKKELRFCNYVVTWHIARILQDQGGRMKLGLTLYKSRLYSNFE